MNGNQDLLIRLMDKVDSIKSEQDSYIAFSKVKLESIEAQAFKTNGRVTKNEKDVQELKTFQTKAMVVWAIAVFAVTTVLSKVGNII